MAIRTQPASAPMYIAEVDTDIPLAEFPPTFETLRERVDCAFAALALLGDDVEVTDDDMALARDLVTGDRKPSEVLLSAPGVIVQVKAILTQYDIAVVESAQQIRTMVTNKLILETENPDPRIRLKALELLGKISDVGLFSEKTEITLRHRPTEELEQMLRERLMTILTPEEAPQHHLADATDATDATVVEPDPNADTPA
jgi:hypothetical protein